jgi:hypothetical protein
MYVTPLNRKVICSSDSNIYSVYLAGTLYSYEIKVRVRGAFTADFDGRHGEPGDMPGVSTALILQNVGIWGGYATMLQSKC